MVEEVPVNPVRDELHEYELTGTAVVPKITELPIQTELLLLTLAREREAAENVAAATES